MATTESPISKFHSILQIDVPKGREGIEQLQVGSALKIPLEELPDTKENIRSALSRVTRQRKMDVSTSSDDSYLYVWKTGA